PHRRGAGPLALRDARPQVRRRARAHLQGRSLGDGQQPRGVHPMKRLLVALLLAACAHAGGNGPADTEIQVLDRSGQPLSGSITLWSRGDKDNCTIYGSSCTVALPTGDYSVTFHKERAGRVGGSIGGPVQGTKSSGCLRARVHVVPGQKVQCK